MIKACLSLAFFCLVFALPLRAFDWETATVGGRDYVTLQSFCRFYGFYYQTPQGNIRFDTRSAQHSLDLKVGSPEMNLDGVHYVMSFPIEAGDHDWLVSRMDVIKLFEPIIRPTEISDRHTIRGVVIDAGHGGSDNGATSRLGAEKNYTIDTAMRLDAILRSAGLKTVFTRRSDVFVDLYERAHIASLYPDYAFVSIHFNSATEEAHGLETYCLSPRGAASTSSAYLTRGDIQKMPGNDNDPQNVLLASMVHSEIIKLNPGDSSADRGVKRARFVVIKQNVLPAILVEGGFVSNHMEAARVDRGDYRQRLAQAIARGVIRFVNVMGDRNLQLPSGSDESSPPPPPAPRAMPVVLPAPSGLASDPANGKPGIHVATTSKHKKDKTKKTPTTPPSLTTPSSSSTNQPGPTAAPSDGPINPSATTPADTTPPPAPASVPPASTPPAPSSSPPAPSAPLNLSEPAVPAPTPGAEKAPEEPDEPPTVNIYPTTPAAKTPPSAPAVESAPPSTNAAPAAPPQP